MFFISTAFADSASAAPNQFMQFIPIIAIFVVFYFFMIRPQSKKAQEHKDFLGLLKAGDIVVTNSGLIGKIREIKSEEVVLEVASGTFIHILKSFISSAYTGDVKISSIAPTKKNDANKENVKKSSKSTSSIENAQENNIEVIDKRN